MKEILRTIYNKILYTILRVLFFWSNDIEFFQHANGSALTFRYKETIYKHFNLPFLFNPRNSFKELLLLRATLKERGITRYIPPFRVERFYLAIKFIPHARDLVRALLGESSFEMRIELLRKAFRLVDYLHESGVIHGDLKSKNILVNSIGELYVVDFEDAFFSERTEDRLEDYRKLVPRIIYLFTAEEIKSLLPSCSAPLRAYLEDYLRPFDIRAIVRSVPGLQFEQDRTSVGEDIDVTVPDIHGLDCIRTCISEKALCYRIFFHSQDDAKCYIYNLSGIQELDVHLLQPLRRIAFFHTKLLRYPALQIAITGPDGVGKTTLIAGIIGRTRDSILKTIPMHTLHASRFVRDGSRMPVAGNWTLTDRVFARIRWGLVGRAFAYRRRLHRNVSPILLLDRSFFDLYLQSDSWLGSHFLFLYRIFFPRNVRTVLLRATSASIRKRKSQISSVEIERYYRRADRYLPKDVVLDSEGGKEEVQERFERLLRYFVLTKKQVPFP